MMRKIPGRRSMRESIAIARHEIAAFFISLSSLLLLAIFVAAVVFHFFWIESFFARNIADVRPMFEWLALLMILLAASLTMRSWSEERRSGTPGAETLHLAGQNEEAGHPAPHLVVPIFGHYAIIWVIALSCLTITIF